MRGLRKPFEDDFNRACDLYHAGELTSACGVLEAIAKEYPEESVVHGLLGGYLYEAGLFDRALSHARKAVELRPRSSGYARDLFLVLHELGQFVEARDEARRFYSIATKLELLEEWGELLEGVEKMIEGTDATT